MSTTKQKTSVIPCNVMHKVVLWEPACCIHHCLLQANGRLRAMEVNSAVEVPSCEVENFSLLSLHRSQRLVWEQILPQVQTSILFTSPLVRRIPRPLYVNNLTQASSTVHGDQARRPRVVEAKNHFQTILKLPKVCYLIKSNEKRNSAQYSHDTNLLCKPVHLEGHHL